MMSYRAQFMVFIPRNSPVIILWEASIRLVTHLFKVLQFCSPGHRATVVSTKHHHAQLVTHIIPCLIIGDADDIHMQTFHKTHVLHSKLPAPLEAGRDFSVRRIDGKTTQEYRLAV